jgi:hypothetical protein
MNSAVVINATWIACPTKRLCNSTHARESSYRTLRDAVQAEWWLWTPELGNLYRKVPIGR